jgi:hypothetical protein
MDAMAGLLGLTFRVQEDKMVKQSKTLVRMALPAAILIVSAGAAGTPSATATPGSARHHRAHRAETSARETLIARCRSEKSSSSHGGACETLNATDTAVDPNSTPALRALLQECLAAKAGRSGASTTACATLDRESGN